LVVQPAQAPDRKTEGGSHAPPQAASEPVAQSRTSIAGRVLTVLVAMTFLGCAQEETPLIIRDAEVPNLFFIQREAQAHFLDSLGYDRPTSFVATRNGNGTSVIFEEGCGSAAVFLSQEGDVTRKTKPSNAAFFNTDGDVVAWFDEARKGFYFPDSDVVVREGASRPFQIEPTGRYFLYGSEFGLTYVASTERPTQILLRSELDFDQLFLVGDRLFLFARSNRLADRGSFRVQDGIVCEEYATSPAGLELKRSFRIERPRPSASPFVVEDMDPSSGLLLLLEVGDAGGLRHEVGYV